MQAKQGFTLLECLLSLALIAIIALFSIPLGVNWYTNNQLELRKQELITLINYARTKAYLLGENLTLTPLPGSEDWSKGALLFIDNPNHQYTSNDKLLHRWQWSEQTVQLQWYGFHSKRYLLFSPNFQQLATNGHFVIQTSHFKPVLLTINRFARVVIR